MMRAIGALAWRGAEDVAYFIFTAPIMVLERGSGVDGVTFFVVYCAWLVAWVLAALWAVIWVARYALALAGLVMLSGCSSIVPLALCAANSAACN
jgi:hypothetical protein